MGMKKLTEGRGDILSKHGKRKEHHALKIHVTSNFPQRSRDIESRRNSTKGLSLFDTSRKLQSTCFSPHPSPPPPTPAIKNLLSGKHQITTKAVSCPELEAFRGEGWRETATFARYTCSDILRAPPLQIKSPLFRKFFPWALFLRITLFLNGERITTIILLHEKFLQYDWLRAMVFQLNLKYVHVKITKLLRAVI